MQLTQAQRDRLKPSQFAGPDRTYPVPDASHARNALARAAQQLKAGNISRAVYERVVRKARRVLARTEGRK